VSIRWSLVRRVFRDEKPSPIVELNRAVAVGMASGPEAGLELVDALVTEPALKGYHLLPAVRGDLLSKVGRRSEARAELLGAAALTENVPERDLLLQRRSSLGRPNRHGALDRQSDSQMATIPTRAGTTWIAAARRKLASCSTSTTPAATIEPHATPRSPGR
jgi:hypothetical protein